ncbi:C-terminal binding protein [Paenibacillus thermotolerans]|uniref:C-terminal binding protein n=1 Tax=Paenibacillus thermotolerans TaxID=3027807 RepID=UPI0023675404|nr:MULTISPECIES: C-terminal binding protein [unclassified Paenibacillus]
MNYRWKIVVTDYEYPDLSYEEAVFADLGEGAFEFVKVQCRTEEEVIAAAANADALMSQYAPIGSRVIKRLERCKVISRYGVGYDVVDVESATAKGICVANVPDYCMDEVSDHTLALLLAWNRKIPQYNRHIRDGHWNYKAETPITRIRGQKLGLIGFGRIPRAVASKARAFGFEVLVYDPFVSSDIVRQSGCEMAELEQLMRESDFVSVHTPLNNHTRGFMNAGLLRCMKKTAFLINTSRGPIVNEDDLVRALQEGWLAGAALDVIEQEPIRPGHPFLTMDNVILTPHVAWYSEQSQAELRTKCATNVLQVLQGYYPTYLVNPEVKQRTELEEI